MPAVTHQGHVLTLCPCPEASGVLVASLVTAQGRPRRLVLERVRNLAKAEGMSSAECWPGASRRPTT